MIRVAVSFRWQKLTDRSKRPISAGRSIREGLTQLLTRVRSDYTELPLYITENGMAEIAGIDDPRRVRFHETHLQAVRAARGQGVDVRGYFAWSLMDNFEWAEGYAKRFGLIEVDFATQKRTPRASYRAFQALLADG